LRGPDKLLKQRSPESPRPKHKGKPGDRESVSSRVKRNEGGRKTDERVLRERQHETLGRGYQRGEEVEGCEEVSGRWRMNQSHKQKASYIST